MAKRIIRHLFTTVIENKKPVTAKVFRDQTIKVIMSLKRRHSADMDAAFLALNKYFGDDFYSPLCRIILGQMSEEGKIYKECPSDKKLLKRINSVIGS